MNSLISEEKLLGLLYERNYRVVVETKSNSKYVTFTSPTAVAPYTKASCYSIDFTDEEIIKDSVYALLKWAGLKVKYSLDY